MTKGKTKDWEILKRFQKDPLYFIEVMFGLVPQKEGEEFEKGKHVSYHQAELIEAVRKAVNGEGKRRISVRSGHGCGKSSALSWLLLWHLFCFKDCQVPCTAPSAEQMYDVLWKEVAKWKGRMPEAVQEAYDWTSSYVRVKDNPAVWFARARTAKKEAPEALAGVHADNVMMLVDECSGVADEIFVVAEGALTEENILVILISNPTRNEGYFYDTFHADAEAWELMHFNSEDSPLVNEPFVDRIITKYGLDSDEYRVRVKGEFPKVGVVDDKGYVPLLMERDLVFGPVVDFIGTPRMGVDPSGEGRDSTVWVVRDNFHAMIVAKEKTSNTKSVAEKTLTLMDVYGVKDEDVYVDNMGHGANVAVELALANKRVNALNVGEKAEDSETYLNKRAEASFRLKDWLRSGGELMGQDGWKPLLTVKYKRSISGKVQIMSKDVMRTCGIKSPDVYDALALTFTQQESSYVKREDNEAFDKFSIV